MTKYKVIGDKLFDFYVNVDASSEEEALDAARDLETHLWQPIDNDRTIQPYDVELIKDSFVQEELDNSDI
jgi:hypothetical protein